MTIDYSLLIAGKILWPYSRPNQYDLTAVLFSHNFRKIFRGDQMMRWVGKIAAAIVLCLAVSGLNSPVPAAYCDCGPNCGANPSTTLNNMHPHQHCSCAKARHDLSDRCCSVLKMDSAIITKPVRLIPGGLFPLNLPSRNITGGDSAKRLQRLTFEFPAGESPTYLSNQTFRC